PSHLLVATYVSSIADVLSLWSSSGPTSYVVSNEPLLSLVAISWPVFGDGSIAPMLGFGDVVMCALYAVATRALGLSVGRTVFALAAGLIAVLGALVLTASPLPALPFLGTAVVAAQPRAWSFQPHERR